MAIFARITILAMFAAAGIAAAVAVALRVDEGAFSRRVQSTLPEWIGAVAWADADQDALGLSAEAQQPAVAGAPTTAGGGETVATGQPVSSQETLQEPPARSAAADSTSVGRQHVEERGELPFSMLPRRVRHQSSTGLYDGPPGLVLDQPEIFDAQAGSSDPRRAVVPRETAYPAAGEPPYVAGYPPTVSHSYWFLQEALKRIQTQQDRTEEALHRIRAELPQRTYPVQATVAPEVDARAETPAESASAAAQETLPPARERQPTVNRGVDDVLTINLQDSDVREVFKLLSEASDLNILASPSVQGSVSASMSNVGVQEALTAILKSTGFSSRRDGNFVFVGNPDELRDMTFVDDVVSTRVYRPNYVTAAEMERLITPMLTPAIGNIAISAASEVGIGSNAIDAGGDNYAGEEVILVRDYEQVLAEIDQVVVELDRMPAQVAIEATILSVKLDDKNELGVDFELLRQRDTIRIVSGNALTSLVSAEFKEGLKIGFLDTSLFLFLEALETIGDTSVIASPRVMCLNKQRAEILIGAELGYVSTTVTETAATQTVEFLEVGTHLRIRPFISSDGMVRMEVHPELSQGSVRVEEGFTLPDKEVTQVTTNIMCRTGSTIVIGGLIREDLITTASQIPVLGNLPVVGTLFRQRTEETDRREIIVLLTPRIISEPEAWAEGERYAEQGFSRRDVFWDKMNPHGKRAIGERYVRLARAAWSAGDPDSALRNVNRAIHFDPLNQEAIDLRKEILAVAPGLEVSVHEHLNRGLAPLHGAHTDYSEYGYPWKDEEVFPDEPFSPRFPVPSGYDPAPAPPPLIPLDAPGEAGRAAIPRPRAARTRRAAPVRRPAPVRQATAGDRPPLRWVSHEESSPAPRHPRLRQPSLVPEKK